VPSKKPGTRHWDLGQFPQSGVIKQIRKRGRVFPHVRLCRDVVGKKPEGTLP